MNKKSIFELIIFLFCGLIFAQNYSAKKISEDAIKKENSQEAIEYIYSVINKVSTPSDKRSLYIFLGNLQESLSIYTDAKNSFVLAASIAAGDASGMPRRSSEKLVIDAVRCALCGGEGEEALQYLNSSVRNSKNEEIQAYIKLYEQWAVLCQAENENDLKEPVSMLEAYLNIDSMRYVRNSILFTLWYITGEDSFANILKKDFPYSTEAGIVCGKVQVMPTPFWYFVPRLKIANVFDSSSNLINKDTGFDKNESVTLDSETSKKSEVTVMPIKQQVGFFKDKENAILFVQRLSEKGFVGNIQEEKRASGQIYFLVLVDDLDGSMGLKLKSAGFECYPVY